MITNNLQYKSKPQASSAFSSTPIFAVAVEFAYIDSWKVI